MGVLSWVVEELKGIPRGSVVIVFGFHAMIKKSKMLRKIRRYRVIIHNTEQLHCYPYSMVMVKRIKQLKEIEGVIEYSKKNMEYWKENGIDMPLGYSDSFRILTQQRCESWGKDDEVIFFGGINERREQYLSKYGITVVNAFGKDYEKLLCRHAFFVKTFF